MLKNIYFLLFLTSISVCGQTVKDTIWMNDNDEVVFKKYASTFKLLKQDKAGKVTLEVYNKKTKKLQSSAYGVVNADETILTLQESSVYNTDGILKFTNTFDGNNNVNKAFSTDLRTNEKYECAFKDNIPYNGKIFFKEREFYLYMDIVDGVTKVITMVNPDNYKNCLTLNYINETTSEEKYFDENGNLLYTAELKNNTFFKGTRVTIFNSTFKLKVIENRKNGEITDISQFYTTGEVRSKATNTNGRYEQTYYSKTGEEIGSHSFRISNESLKKKEGVLFVFDNQDHEDNILNASYYSNNEIIKIADYYTYPKKNVVKSITYRKNGTPRGIDRIEYFNEDGSPKGQITFNDKGLAPYEGTQIKDQETTIYKNGEIVERSTYYSNGKISHLTKDQISICYDIKGKEIGRVTLNKTDDDAKIYNTGTVYTIEDDLITQISTYENSLSVRDKLYSIDNEISQLALDVTYKKGNPYQSTMFYPNGNKAIEFVYGLGESPTLSKGTYYQKTGELIGTYDYIYETGTLVKYTDNLEVVSIETFKEGKPLTKKEFGIYNEDKVFSEPSYYVYSYIDYNKLGETYDESGEVLSSTEYRDGVPYEGLAYTYDTESNIATETSYKEGKKVDKETIKNVETNEIIKVNFYEEGVLTKIAFYNKGILFKIAEYKDNQLEGNTTFFSPDNKLVSTVSFSENQAINGTYIYVEENYIVKTLFKEGKKLSKQIYFYNPVNNKEALVLSEKYNEDNSIDRSLYNPNTAKLVYDYTIKDDVLNGLFKYYEGDRLKYQATFKDGKLSEGTVAIIDFHFNPIEDKPEDYVNHTVITKNKETYYLTILDESRKELLNMQIKETSGDNNYNALFNTPILIENLYPYNALNNSPSEWKVFEPTKPDDLKPNYLDSIF